MNPILSASKVALAAALISVMFAGCERRAADEVPSAAGSSTPGAERSAGATGSTGTDSSSNPSVAASPSSPGSPSSPSSSGSSGDLAKSNGGADTNAATSGAAGSSTTTSSGGSSAGSSAGSTDAAKSGSTDTSGASGSSSGSVGAAVEDSVITTKIKTALLADPDVKGLDISVETNKGEAVLTGAVDSKAQADQALKVARGIEGVKKVTNKLTVKKQ